MPALLTSIQNTLDRVFLYVMVYKDGMSLFCILVLYPYQSIVFLFVYLSFSLWHRTIVHPVFYSITYSVIYDL